MNAISPAMETVTNHQLNHHSKSSTKESLTIRRLYQTIGKEMTMIGIVHVFDQICT